MAVSLPPAMKVALSLFVIFFVIVSLRPAEGKTIIRVKKPKIYVSPKHIQALESINSGVYATGYGYDKPVPRFALEKRTGRQTIIRKKNKSKNKIKYVKYGGVQTYAKRYKTWAPSKEFVPTRNTIIIETPRPKSSRRRPTLQTPTTIAEDYSTSSTRKRRRRVKPSSLRKPQPPLQESLYDEYEEEDYFPEETKRQETDYELDDGYRPEKKKRKRKPSIRKRKPSKPEEVKYHFEEERPFRQDGRYTPSSVGPSPTSVSYSNFVQHPLGQRDPDYDYPVSEEEKYVRKEQKKRKRQKRPKPTPDEFRRPLELEEPGRFQYEEERFPPYFPSHDAATQPDRSHNKQTRFKPQFETTPTPIYGDGHIDQSTRFRYPARPSSAPEYPQEYQGDSDYRVYRQTTAATYVPAFRPAPTLANEFGPPYQTPDRFPPSDDAFSRPYRDYTSQQGSQGNTYNVGVSSSGGNFNSFPKTPVHQASPPVQPSPSFNGFSPALSTPSFASPPLSSIPSGTSYQSTVLNQGQSYSSINKQHYKPGTTYDNTETFYDFSQNVNHGNSQGGKELDNNFFTRYNNRQSDTQDQETEFIAKHHQNLYNNGITGVPIQGDGFGKVKDYDIGYGEYQFDENRGP